jgi:hypothetical protein
VAPPIHLAGQASVAASTKDRSTAVVAARVVAPMTLLLALAVMEASLAVALEVVVLLSIAVQQQQAVLAALVMSW